MQFGHLEESSCDRTRERWDAGIISLSEGGISSKGEGDRGRRTAHSKKRLKDHRGGEKARGTPELGEKHHQHEERVAHAPRGGTSLLYPKEKKTRALSKNMRKRGKEMGQPGTGFFQKGEGKKGPGCSQRNPANSEGKTGEKNISRYRVASSIQKGGEDTDKRGRKEEDRRTDSEKPRVQGE